MPDNRPQIRQKFLLDQLELLGLDALLLNPGPSLTYLSGLDFHLSERPITAVFRPDGIPLIVLPELEEAKVRSLPYEFRSFTYGEDPSTWGRAFGQAAAEAGLDYRRIGVEPRRLRVLELRLLEEAAPRAAYLNGEAAIAALRMKKDESEIAAMRNAVRVAEQALEAALAVMRPGISEKAFARELSAEMYRAGSAPELPFSPIVAFGPETANPHAIPSDRTLEEGDLILVDWGASIDGYFSDLTRMFCFGQVEEELTVITEIVTEANHAAREIAGPGVTARDVDRAARKVIESAGFGQHFVHRTGHGLGLEGHEEPYIRGDNSQELEPGMTFTVEPGIYLPGRGGARIEDDVIITSDGAESLSRLQRGLVDIEDVTTAVTSRKK